MTVTCPKCAKSLKVKDEYQGKMLKCPQCQSAFRADAKGVKAAGAAALKVQPKPGEKLKREKGGVAINWGTIVLWGGLAMIPLAIILFLVGPMRVKRHWDANQERVEGEVRDVLELALKVQASRAGVWNPRKSGRSPSVADLQMRPEIFAFSVPRTVHFEGFTSNGTFTGTYAFEGGEVDADVKIEGLTLPSGIHLGANGVQVAGAPGSNNPAGVGKSLKAFSGAGTPDAFHVTGRVTAAEPTAELDGKKGEVYYPPELDDDGNPVVPDPAATPSATKPGR